ncbi:MAG: hypothetical protein AB7R40_22210 [Nitrospiraceae bacterium]
MKTEQQFIEALLRWFGLGGPLIEAVRNDQSYEALRVQLSQALSGDWVGKPMGVTSVRVAWTFSDRVIAYTWVETEDEIRRMAWEIPWAAAEGGGFTFGTPVEVKEVLLFEPVAESQQGQRQRLVETIEQRLVPLAESSGAGGNGARRVRAIGITADVVNGNGRRYRRSVLAEAVARLNSKLNESAGQGRYILSGEAEHPIDKGGRPNILETVFKWEAASLNAAGQVLLEGVILPTSKGKDLQVLAENGVPIRLSQRGYGLSTRVEENGQEIQEVTQLEITGYDAVANPADPNARLVESQAEQPKQAEGKDAQKSGKGEKKMTLEEMLAALQGNPEKLAEFLQANPALAEAVVGKLGYADKRQLAGQLGVNPARLEQSITEMMEAQRELEERKHAEMIEAAIQDACKNLPYGKLNAQFVESVRAEKPQKQEAIFAIVEAKTKEWDALLSAAKLSGMGGSGVRVLGPVFERETGQPEYTKAAWELNESLVRTGNGTRRDLRQAEFGSVLYTQRVLKVFDEQYRRQLAQEARQFEEAEQASDLNLPYSVMRTIIEQAYPELVAANIFDFGIADGSPTRLYFESYAGESGAAPTVTDEVVTGDHDTWVELTKQRLRPGTVVLTNSGGTTTYVEGSDYVVDYGGGKLMTLSAGTTTDSQSLKIDYVYDAFRKGEMAEIERAKNTLSFITLEIAADRLATEISNEAVVFSRSQLGYDAVGRTLGNLTRLVRRKIDKDILYLALAACLRQANNSGGTWTSASDPITQLVEKIGYAKVKVENRFYMTNGIVMSKTNADRLSNWDGFTRDGFPNAVLTAAGYAGSIKGLPIWATPEFGDGYTMVAHRELVQHRVMQPMMLKGPFPSFSNGKLVAADQYYIEEYNGTETPVVEKGAYMVIA